MTFVQVMPLVSVSALHDVDGIINGNIHFPGQNNQNEVQHNFLCQEMLLLLANDIISQPLHSLGKDDNNEVQHDFFAHVAPFASHEADGITNDTILFLMSK